MLLNCPPVVTIFTLPPLNVASISTLMPLPPEPVLFSQSSPAFTVSVESALMPAAPLHSWSSVSYMPLPLVKTVVRPPFTMMWLSQLMPLAAAADTSTFRIPPLIKIPSLALMP